MVLSSKLKLDANNRSYVTNGDKSWTKTKWMTGNQYKPNISVFIRDTDSIRDNTIHEGESYEAEHRFNWERHSSSAGVAGMLLHIYGKFTTWKLKLSLLKKNCSSYEVVQAQGNRCDQNSQ